MYVLKVVMQASQHLRSKQMVMVIIFLMYLIIMMPTIKIVYWGDLIIPSGPINFLR